MPLTSSAVRGDRGPRAWPRALPPLALSASIVPVLLGASVAVAQGAFAPGPFALTLVLAVAIAAAVGPRAIPAALVFLGFGPVMALGAYYAQTHAFDLVPALYALPVGCLVAAIRLPPRRGRVLLGTAYLLLAAGVLAGTFVRWAVLPLLTVPLALAFVRRACRAGPDDGGAVEAAAVKVYLAFGLLLVTGVLL